MKSNALLCCLLCCACLLASEEHFWDKQALSTWTSEQTAQFETTSPWAKQVTATLISNDSNMAGGGTRAAGGGGGRRGGAVYSGSSRGSSSSSPDAGIPKFQAIVRWVNAPMRQLLKPKLPDTFKGHYILSVTGLPIGEDPSTLTEQTTLQIKRGNPINPELAYQDPYDTATIYFAFLPSTLDVTSSKTAEFHMTAAPFEIKAKFLLNEMKISGEQAF